MTNDTKWADGLDEDIAFLREHDPKGLNVAFNHIPPVKTVACGSNFAWRWDGNNSLQRARKIPDIAVFPMSPSGP
jgi:hypothetical protein